MDTGQLIKMVREGHDPDTLINLEITRSMVYDHLDEEVSYGSGGDGWVFRVGGRPIFTIDSEDGTVRMLTPMPILKKILDKIF